MANNSDTEVQHELKEFIRSEMDKRGMSMRQFANLAKLPHSTIARSLQPHERIGYKVTIDLARALKADPVNMLVLSGLLPASDEASFQERQMLYTFRQLTAAQQRQVLSYLDFIARGN